MERRNETICFSARLLFFPLAILWMECTLRYTCLGVLFAPDLWHILLFTLPPGLLCALVCTLWGARGNRRAAVALTATLTL
ncbi:MAG: hypothetical protein RR216_02070, partial [Pseudoflavonifractor sp.]